MDTIKTEITYNELNSYLMAHKNSKIKIVGIGGSGGNIINHMINVEGIDRIDHIVVDTDIYALDRSIAPYKLLLGINMTRAIGSGMGSERGRKSAIESIDEIKEILRGSDIVFIVVGLGGCTGTGAAPIVARVAKELGALTISIVTSPFEFEGRKRTKLTSLGIEAIKRESDSIVVVKNENILETEKNNLDTKESFKLVEDVMLRAVSAISKAIILEEEAYWGNDFISAKNIMNYKELAVMGTGYSIGIKAAYHAAKEAIESPLLDKNFVEDAMALLVHFEIHPDYSIMEINEAMCFVEENVDEDASVLFSTERNNEMGINEVMITIVATGFEKV